MPQPKRQHAQRKQAAGQPEAAPVTPTKSSETPRDEVRRDALVQALAADVGPLVITIAGNLVTRKVQVTENAENDVQVAILMEWLDSARGYLQNKLLAAAEARGRAAATATGPGADSGVKPT